MNWTIEKKVIERHIDHFKVMEEDRYLSFKEVFNLWENSLPFQTFYARLLSEHRFKAYFWEHPSLTLENVETDYEFVLVQSTSLTKVRPDRLSFKSFFNSNSKIVSFPNLRGDAQLIVPCPIDNLDFTHLANFIRLAPKNQISEFWKMLSQTIQDRLSQEKLWISTSGLGVHWLHVRLDRRPKYYQYEAYKM